MYVYAMITHTFSWIEMGKDDLCDILPNIARRKWLCIMAHIAKVIEEHECRNERQV